MRALIVMLLLLLCASPARAMDVRGTDFAAIPVLHEGRIKPMDSFARALHWRITGRQAGRNADQWLAEILFNPLAAAERPQFDIRNPELAALLELPARKPPRYSFAELSAGLAPHAAMIGTLAAQDKLSATQEQLLQLQQAVIDYTQLMRSFSMVLPLAVTWPGAQGDTYLDMLPFAASAEQQAARVARRKGSDLSQYTETERAAAAFSFQMTVIRESAAGNALLRVIPSSWQPGEWLSPWSVLQSGQGSPQTAVALKQWKGLAAAWNAGDRAAFMETATALAAPHRTPRLVAERAYNVFSPLSLSLSLYLIATFAGLVALRRPEWNSMAAGCAAGGTIILTAGLALRVYILERPPVGTLYESVLFVALITVFTALILARKNPALMAASSSLGALLLFIAPLLIRGGDALPVLVAVLNTNFWLATHVIIITAGYGFSLLCALAAHLWLAGAALGQPQSVLPMHRLGLLALLFTTVGTILGGIWADQSWGRFWGWDPKENGALLIVLWLVWAMHGRRAALLPPALYAVTLAFTSVIVALAWFGVNLLNVGLHSYGFTSGIAAALFAFCAFETALIGGLFWMGRGKRHEA